ncbi:GPP34 family phosphoprotein [Streptacidiphilus carbonis]|uniref:GPP34 family phosphoprotein n=1 Tax=Streptacidiphilus carbonis TaxID=105422 RepID=UPI0005AA1E3F|nr:GPP34 family phosphoprotein [Streptacidiphilus carbonis]
MDQSPTSPTGVAEDLLLLCAAAGPELRVVTPAYFMPALAAGVVADLLRSGYAVLDEDRLRLVSAAPSGNLTTDAVVLGLTQGVGGLYAGPLIDCVEWLAAWIARPVLDSMVNRGLLYTQEHRRSFGRATTGYHLRDRAAFDRCSAELTRAAADLNAPGRTRLLGALVHAGRLTSCYFDAQQPKSGGEAARRLAHLMDMDQLARAANALVNRQLAGEAAMHVAAEQSAAALTVLHAMAAGA